MIWSSSMRVWKEWQWISRRLCSKIASFESLQGRRVSIFVYAFLLPPEKKREGVGVWANVERWKIAFYSFFKYINFWNFDKKGGALNTL
jgi:hypothetical protein